MFTSGVSKSILLLLLVMVDACYDRDRGIISFRLKWFLSDGAP